MPSHHLTSDQWRERIHATEVARRANAAALANRDALAEQLLRLEFDADRDELDYEHELQAARAFLDGGLTPHLDPHGYYA